MPVTTLTVDGYGLSGIYYQLKILSLFRKISHYMSSASLSKFIDVAKFNNLYKSYSVAKSKRSKLCISVQNSSFNAAVKYKKYDIMFSGELIAQNKPLLFVEAVKRVKEKIGQCNVFILGEGPLRNDTLIALLKSNIDFDYLGSVQPQHLHLYYNQSKIIFFPILNDQDIVSYKDYPFDIPVITYKNKTATNNLLRYNLNTYILPLDKEKWIKQICNLLKTANRDD